MHGAGRPRSTATRAGNGNTEMTDRTTCRIAFPALHPVDGYFASIDYLDRTGYLAEGCDYARSLEKAGLVLVKDDTGFHLEFSATPRGMFSNGVSHVAEGMLAALARDGFEGFVRQDGRTWCLTSGRVIASGQDLRLVA
mgnify:CR=1 FL=1